MKIDALVTGQAIGMQGREAMTLSQNTLNHGQIMAEIRECRKSQAALQAKMTEVMPFTEEYEQLCDEHGYMELEIQELLRA